MAVTKSADVVYAPLEDQADALRGEPMLQSLFRLWDSARNGRRMPARRDFTPESLRPWLGNLALIDVTHNPTRMHYRLVGIHIVDNLKRDPTGKTMDDVVVDPANNPATQGLYRCLVHGEPMYEVMPPRCGGMFSFNCARISLPLSNDGQTINMILMGEYVINRPGVPGAQAIRARERGK